MLSEVLPPFFFCYKCEFELVDYPVHCGVIGDENNDRGFEYGA